MDAPPPPGRPRPQDRLAAALGARPDALHHLARLDDEAVDRLARLVAEAAVREGAAIDRCMDEALRVMPRPLRGPVRRILGMGDR